MQRAVSGVCRRRAPGRRCNSLASIPPAMQRHFGAPELVPGPKEAPPTVARTVDVDTRAVKDLSVQQWPWPGIEMVTPEYPDPRPTQTCGNPRPSVMAAAETGDPALVQKALDWEWVEEAGDGLGSRWDPSGQLCNDGVNSDSTRDVWVRHPQLFDLQEHTLAGDATFVPEIVSVVPPTGRGQPGTPFMRVGGVGSHHGATESSFSTATSAAAGANSAGPAGTPASGAEVDGEEEEGSASSDSGAASAVLDPAALAEGGRLALSKCSASALGWCVLHNRADIVRVLLHSTLVNPNIPIVFHGVEPPRDATAVAAAAAATPSRGSKRGPRLKKAPSRAGVGAAVPAARANAPYSHHVSPLYYALARGYHDVADALLAHPRTDSRVGFRPSSPLSRVPARACSALRPELAQGEAALDARDARPRLAQDIRDWDWVAAGRASKSNDVQKEQRYSFGIHA